MTGHLAGKIALVTGGARGVGAATAMRLSAMGATVYVADLDEVSAHEAPHLLKTISRSYALDVTDSGAWAALVEDLREREGRLDIVHLNAGIQARPMDHATDDDPLLWFDEEVCDRLIAVNVKGVTNGISACLDLLRESHGSIVITASLAGVRAFAGDPLYSMTKHAVVGLTRALGPRLEQDGICINAVCPGGIHTRMVAKSTAATGVQLITPEEVAQVVCEVARKRSHGGIWLLPLDGSVRKFEIDAVEYTEEHRMSIAELERS